MRTGDLTRSELSGARSRFPSESGASLIIRSSSSQVICATLTSSRFRALHLFRPCSTQPNHHYLLHRRQCHIQGNTSILQHVLVLFTFIPPYVFPINVYFWSIILNTLTIRLLVCMMVYTYIRSKRCTLPLPCP